MFNICEHISSQVGEFLPESSVLEVQSSHKDSTSTMVALGTKSPVCELLGMVEPCHPSEVPSEAPYGLALTPSPAHSSQPYLLRLPEPRPITAVRWLPEAP